MAEDNGSTVKRRVPAGLDTGFNMPGGVDDLFEERKINVFVRGRNNRAKVPVPFVIWESVDKCDPETCPVGKGCEHMGFCENEKCAVQAKYLGSVMEVVFKAIDKRADEMALMEVGFLLIPLFNQLVKLKIQEVGLQGRIVEYTKKGPMINPILKEMRSCIMTIKATMQDLIHKKDLKDDAVKIPGNITAVGNTQEGMPDYYAALRAKPTKPTESLPGVVLETTADSVITKTNHNQRKIPHKYSPMKLGEMDPVNVRKAERRRQLMTEQEKAEEHDEQRMMAEEAGQGDES